MMLGALSAAVITIGVETLLLGLLYRRDTLFLGLCASLNLATNLVLNLVLWLIPLTVRWWLVYPLELLVVAGGIRRLCPRLRPLRAAVPADARGKCAQLLHRHTHLWTRLRKEVK